MTNYFDEILKLTDAINKHTVINKQDPNFKEFTIHTIVKRKSKS